MLFLVVEKVVGADNADNQKNQDKEKATNSVII